MTVNDFVQVVFAQCVKTSLSAPNRQALSAVLHEYIFAIRLTCASMVSHVTYYNRLHRYALYFLLRLTIPISIFMQIVHVVHYAFD